MKTYKIFNGSEWVIGTPVDGEVCREIKGSGSNEHYIEYTYRAENTPIDIVVTGISTPNDANGITHDADFSNAITYVDTVISVVGTLLVPDTTFSLPIMRNDGRLFMFEANVVGGVFTSLIKFPTSGSFSYSNNECNLDLPPNTFNVNTIKFDVRDKVTV